MVLVACIREKHVRILPTQFRYREWYAARRVGLAAVPLAQHIAGRHGAGQARLQSPPAPRPHVLHMAAPGPPGAPRRHPPPVLPRAALTHGAMARLTRRGLAAGLPQDAPRVVPWAPPPLPGVLGALGGGAGPPPRAPPSAGAADRVSRRHARAAARDLCGLPGGASGLRAGAGARRCPPCPGRRAPAQPPSQPAARREA